VGNDPLKFMYSPHKRWAMGAHPIGAPGCPDLAFSTTSADNTRMVLMHFSARATSSSDLDFFVGAEDLAGDDPLRLGGIDKNFEVNAERWQEINRRVVAMSVLFFASRHLFLSRRSSRR
jgi:hypothetical protein